MFLTTSRIVTCIILDILTEKMLQITARLYNFGR
jgi:hypothetical protein